MNLFGRLSDLVSVNFHALLDSVENPERTLARLLERMEDSLAEVREQTATAIAAERRLNRELQQCQAAAAHWQARARLALAKGREDLARSALVHKIDQDTATSDLREQHEAARQWSDEARESLQLLERRLDDARRRHTCVLARQRLLEARFRLERSRGASLSSAAAPFFRFEKIERHLIGEADVLHAQLELTRVGGELEDELANLERSDKVDKELEALKSNGPEGPSIGA